MTHSPLICAVLASAMLLQAAPVLRSLDALSGFETSNATTGSISLAVGQTQATLHAGSRRLDLPAITVWMNHGSHIDSNGWSVAESDVRTVLLPLMVATSAPGRTLRVMLDPGHGGADGGAEAPSTQALEKTITLDVAKRTAKLLKRSGHNVRLTRTADHALTLNERVQLADQWDADIFISIHANSAHNAMASGIETFVVPCAGAQSTSNGSFSTNACPGNAHDRQNTLLGAAIHSGVIAQTRHIDRGLKRARYEVIRNAACPAALVECGFLSSSVDAARLDSKTYRQQLALGIAKGVNHYCSQR